MSGNPLVALGASGQSPWLDYIHRGMIISGELGRRIAEDGIRGVTSNPTIFEKAVSTGSDYDAQIPALARGGVPLLEAHTRIVTHDIRAAADVLRPVYNASAGDDGYVSLAVDPDLARAFDAFLADEPEWNRDDLKKGLLLLEYGPVIFEGRLSTFSQLGAAERLAHFERWGQGGLLRRQLALASRLHRTGPTPPPRRFLQPPTLPPPSKRRREVLLPAMCRTSCCSVMAMKRWGMPSRRPCAPGERLRRRQRRQAVPMRRRC